MICVNKDIICEIYRKYSDDLTRVRKKQRVLYQEKGYKYIDKFYPVKSLKFILKKCGFENKKRLMKPQLDDIEAEITYLLVRNFKPKNIVEISPCGGWSTSWILNAIRDNGQGNLFSYDIIDYSTLMVPSELTGSWKLIKGDIKANLNKLPNKIDYLFIDSNHSAEFAKWYIDNIFPRINDGVFVSVHDVFHRSKPKKNSEGSVITNWLKENRIPFFTPSPAKNGKIFYELMSLKRELGIDNLVHFSKANSMIFFRMKN